jgi:hypothetical protein
MKIKYSVFFLFVLASFHLEAQNLNLPPHIDLFQYAKSNAVIPNITDYGIFYRNIYGYPLFGFPKARIWGWSRNGTAAYSIETEMPGRGGQIIEFVIFDFVSDRKVFELKIDSFNHNDDRDGALYNIYIDRIREALWRNNIIERQIDYLPFPIKTNNAVYNAYRTIKFRDTDDDVYVGKRENYSIIIDRNNERAKTIRTANNMPVASPISVYICGYFLSPFENRALVVIAEERFTFEGTEIFYAFSGCHLDIGFN